MKQNQRQAQQLANRLAATIMAYSAQEEEAGTPMLGNDIMSALAHLLGSLLSQVPAEHSDRVYGQIGTMVLQSRDIHFLAKRMAEGGGGTFLMTEDEHGNVVVEELSGGPLQ